MIFEQMLVKMLDCRLNGGKQVNISRQGDIAIADIFRCEREEYLFTAAVTAWAGEHIEQNKKR